MPYNLSIPGQMTERELWAIEALAKLVPPGGIIVEVGSFLGLSSYAWAKSVHPSVTVYCIDPWDGNSPGGAEFHKRHKVDFSLSTFKNFVKNCPNIVPLQGYSPQDFPTWDREIDLYFEDAVHKNPILQKNIKFWSSFVKPGGIICGHDYRDKFPDVVAEVNELSRKYSVELITVDSLWCLPLKENANNFSAVAKLAQINGYKYEIEIDEYPSSIIWGKVINIKGKVKNISGRDFDVFVDEKEIIKIGIKVYQDNSKNSCLNFRESLGVEKLTDGSTAEFNIKFHTHTIEVETITLEIDLVAEYWYWFRNKGVEPKSITVQVLSKALECDFRDVFSWMRYLQNNSDSNSLGWKLIKNQTYQFETKTAKSVCKSMLSQYELALLYMLTKDYYSGQGEILDLGPYLGLSTNVLARGLHQNERLDEQQKAGRIYSFDIFLSEGYERFLGNDIPLTGSIFQDYLKLNREYLDYLCICPGDLRHFKWISKPVEIVFIDIAKSWELNDWVIKQVFSNLIPGVSIIVQQDYIHFNEYWIHITMEYFQEYFELLYMLYGASAVYRYIKAIPKELLRIELEKLSIEKKSSLLDRARAKAPEPVQEVMKIAHAKCLIEHGSYDEAAELLRAVDTKPKTDDPILNVAGIAHSNLAVVDTLFKAATGRSALS